MMSETKEYYRYLPVSSREEQWGLCVTGAGYAQIAPGRDYPLQTHIHPTAHEFDWRRGRSFHEYALVYIIEGQGEFEGKSRERIPLKAGNIIILFPEVWHRYRPFPETGWTEYWVTFYGNQAKQLVDAGFLTPEMPVLYPGLDETIIQAFKDIFNRLRFEGMGFQHIIAAEVLLMVAAVLGGVKKQETPDDLHHSMLRAKQAIEEQTEGVIVVEDLASALGLSAGHFRHLFKKQTGFSPYQYHLQLKISRAKSLLRSSNLSIKQIAFRLGFQNVFHFSKLFKNKTQKSPSQWRRGV